MKKQIIAGMAAAMVCVGAVGGTFAYLTSTDAVTNTFSVGKVKITLDEAKVDGTGKEITGDGAERVKANSYHLIPGGEYDKDPTVHVDVKSEESYIFVKVSNGIETVANVSTQIVANGWNALGDSYSGVYYIEYDPEEAEDEDGDGYVDYVVFEKISIAGGVTGEELEGLGSAELTVNAYAIQKAGFTSAENAYSEFTKTVDASE